MSEPETHSSFIKTPQQLVLVVLAGFAVPVVAILLLVKLVVDRPRAEPQALEPEAVAERIQPVGRVEFGTATVAAAGPRAAEDIYKTVCAACHQTGAAGAPKVGDRAAWAPRIRAGLNRMLADTIKGKGAMPPRGGGAELSDFELARAIVWMANQSGASLREPVPPKK